MEVTGPQMVLVMKLSTFAWNVYDGRRKEEVRVQGSSTSSERHADIKQELDKWQLAKRVTQYPTLLEFLGYSCVRIINAPTSPTEETSTASISRASSSDLTSITLSIKMSLMRPCSITPT